MGTFKRGLMPIRIVFFEEGLDEGANANAAYEFYGVCLFSETDGEIHADDGRDVETVAKAVIDGDAAPKLGVIGGGDVTVDTPYGERKFRIARARRVRVASHKVRHTVLELCR